MAWVCPVCSTNNDDSEKKCIVCDQERVVNKICTLTAEKVRTLGLSGDVVVPFEFNVIGEGAFKGRTDIYSVTLHEGVRKISKEAFCGCRNLKRIICDTVLETVSIRAFADCEALPVSERVRSDYVSDTAYYVTPKPAPSSVYSAGASASTASRTRSSSSSSGSSATSDSMSAEEENALIKKLAQFVFLGLSALFSIPVAIIFVSRFQRSEYVVYGVFVGAALTALLVSAIFSRHSDEDGKIFNQRYKIIPIILVLIVSYVIEVIFGIRFAIVNVCVNVATLALSVRSLLSILRTSKKRGLKFILCLLIVNAVLIWRILVA